MISPSLIGLIEVSLDTLIRAVGIDIRLHGLQHVPREPVIYVINHFTRVETVLMPYLIKKHVHKFPLSLAAEMFFDGDNAVWMKKLGAVSTADPERDRIFIKALLTDEHPVIIFPEGQIIKDKKIIEKGKFMVYNAGIRRPPHAGAAQIALRAEMIREQLRRLRARNDDHAVTCIAEHFGIGLEDIHHAVSKDTYIVPVNITYYPVRARENALSRFAHRFIKNLSPRFEEELEVEGLIALGKVDIDIRFGKPLAVKDYLDADKKLADMLSTDDLYLDAAAFKSNISFKKTAIKMMRDYMRSIYGMTTVNHDHLFSYILTRYRKNRFTEHDFKNRVFLAIQHLRDIGLMNCHTSLYQKQFYLLTDDVHDKYDDFMKEATSGGYISLHQGIITKNTARFSRKSEFHRVRKENLLEVLKNEIEPLEQLTRALNRLMWLPGFFLRWKIRNHFLRLDENLFEKDYREFYREGESKPPHIGRPFFLKRFFSAKGVILIHGYMAAPEEIRPLADYLHRNGYNVYGVRLRGHGTAPEDLAIRNWEKWYDSASRAYIIMKNSVRAVAVGGFSMGAGIALLQAANKPGRFAGVVSINAPLVLKGLAPKFAFLVDSWNKLLTNMQVEKGKMEFVKNEPENPEINYLRNPVSGSHQLERMMRQAKQKLKNISDPTLIIQASDDPVVNPVSAVEIFNQLGTANKQLLTIYAGHHGILRGEEASKVNSAVLMFLKNVLEK
jgi:esterase/lipase/1-acyl-sn-glycerol-3-phosphate acyltransferase